MATTQIASCTIAYSIRIAISYDRDDLVSGTVRVACRALCHDCPIFRSHISVGTRSSSSVDLQKISRLLVLFAIVASYRRSYIHHVYYYYYYYFYYYYYY